MSKILSIRPCVCSAVVALIAACGSDPVSGSLPTNDVAVADDPLLDAPLDTSHLFDVGICAGGLNATTGTCASVKCSGTLIAPNLVLTARHCVRDISYGNSFCESVFTDDGFSDGPVFVTTSSSTIVGEPKWYTVAAMTLPEGNNLCNDDVALLRLASAVPLREVRPVPVNLSRDVAAHQPKEVAIVGRGVISEVLDLDTFELHVVTGDLQRRVLEHVPFDCATNDANSPCNVVDYSSPPTNEFASPPAYLVISKAIASGDSGCGIFDQDSFANRRPAVIGVSSAGTYGPDGVPNHGLIARLDTHRDIFENALREAADALLLERDAFALQME